MLFSLAFLAMLVSPAPDTVRYALVPVYICLNNIMACCVFRGVALGMIERSPTVMGLTTTRLAAAFEMRPCAPGESRIAEAPMDRFS